jgi:hypothetical protein
MPSLLAWIDHDPAERERMQRILALFQERETRDELGLGAIRDSFADQLFPGTSTIQTRLRYMLFVPWIYQEIERRHVPSDRVAAVARQMELSLATTLIPEGEWGVFGKTARGALKRLPSSVYWAGLDSWGIRRFSGSQEQYHRGLDEIHRLRRAASRWEEREAGWAGATETWHPKLPPAPEGFPARADFRLTLEEAEFLRERIATTHPRSLLAYLVLHAGPAPVDFPWMHPEYASFPQHNRELLHHARLFSEAMEGASILYNLMLAQRAEQRDREEEHRGRFEDWAESIEVTAIRDWDLERLWVLVSGTGHTITSRARAFVEHWIESVRRGPHAIPALDGARTLVRVRETSLKGGRSRFTNRRALEQWTGYAGMQPMSFRWTTARDFLTDLHAAREVRANA